MKIRGNRIYMINVFEVFNSFEDEIIIEHIAMLEAINIENVVKGYGTSIANKGAKLINGVSGFLGKNFKLEVKKEKRLEDYINDKRYQYKGLSRERLNSRFRILLWNKSNSYSETDECISASVINLVANHMNIEENMTISQKADGIHRRYLEKMLKIIQEKLQSQNSEETKNTINQIENSINTLSNSDKEELKNVLNINELTGKEIRNVLLRSGTPTVIIAALSASGFGAYMALTSIIHAIFTTFLGITLPFAVYTSATSLLAFVLGPAGIALIAGTAIWQMKKGNKNLNCEVMGQIIFIAVNAMGGRCTVEDNKLPSYECNKDTLKKVNKIDEEYKKIVEENIRLESKVKKLESIYKKSQDDIEAYKKKIEKQKNIKNNSENIIKKLQLEKENTTQKLKDLEHGIKRLADLEKSMDLNKLYENELSEISKKIQYQNSIIKSASSEIDNKTKLINEIELKNITLQNDNEDYKKQIQKMSEKLVNIEEIRKRDLQEKWRVYYPKFEFKMSAIRDATKFSKKEIWEIERALIELHSLKDYRAVSIGKIKQSNGEYEHMAIRLPDGFPARILYKIIKNQNKVAIEKIYKHNSKIYK